MSDWPDTNPSLILRIKDPQNAAAWNQLMAIYRPVIYRLARRKGLLHEDAEDLVQGVFISTAKAIDRWEQGEGQPRFRNWLGRITRNAIVNAITRARPDRATGTSSVLQSLASLPQGTESTQSLIVECRLEAIRWAAREIQSEFSNATWAIFQSIAIEGRPAPEVAQVFQRTIGAVYAARCRVAARLREKVLEASAYWSEF
jgi:RNA polymerase sigma-70 factor (ECF subfamily)